MEKQICPNVYKRTCCKARLTCFCSFAACAIPFALAQRNGTKPEAPSKPSQRTPTLEARVINSIPPSGSVQEEWVARYNGSGDSSNVATAIAIDELGERLCDRSIAPAWTLILILITPRSSTNASGTQEWVARYNGPGNYC